MNFLLAAAVASALCPQQEGKAAENPWKIDVKLALEQSGTDWIFVIEGTTNLPSRTILRARIYAVERVMGPRGPREDEEPLVWEDDPDALNPGFQTFEAGEGKFRIEVYKFPRKPFSLQYRGKVHYQPNLQPRDVVARVTVEDFAGASDLRLGTKADFAREQKERADVACKELDEIRELYHELKKKFAEHQAKYDKASWKAWKDPWYERIEKIYERNKERYGLWAVWVERQAKMRIGGMCDILRGTLVSCTEALEGDAEALTRAQKRLEGFHPYYEEAVEIICPNAPLDGTHIAPLLAAYEKGFLPVRDWVEKGEGEWAPARAAARRECAAALLQLPPHVKTRKTAYRFVSDLSDRFTRLLELADAKAEPAALRKALADHDRVLAEFKKLAGLK